MITAAQTTLRVVLYEGSGSHPLDDAARLALVRALLEKGYPLTNVRDRGRLSAIQEGIAVVLGRFAEAPPALAEDAAANVRCYFHNLEGLSAPQAVEAVEAVRKECCSPEQKFWKPWFPVIDYNRCTNCMQCLSFCLFDVYSVSGEGKIKVQNQQNCKTDCPACSRVCPEVAILFPKYKAGPINGDEINSEDVRREAMKVDISSLLGGDIYAALRDRSAKAKSRFSKERDEDRALKERMRCLAKLQEQLEIPPELMSALPTPDEIRVKAEQAKARAAAALASMPPAAIS
jgi:NAD-dependent dihydropyrimidine dehydrogenase PreA subunit